MKKHVFIFNQNVFGFIFGFTSALIALGITSTFAFAADIQYPVKELGNCANKESCKTYCDSFSNIEACLDFAEKNSMMSIAEIQAARKFLSAGSGPGGCSTKDSCETYCDSIEHIEECVAFAEENELMPPEELEEAKKVMAAKARGVKMPACANKKQCDAYCSQASHMEECITFAQEAGFLPPEELEEAKKVLTAIKSGATPPPCRGKNECDAYCSQEEHFDSCLDFALAAGFMDPKEAEMAKKTKGKGPGGCRGKEQCEAFCQKDENMTECAQFAYENGMMTQEEFEMMKKTGGKGPGGCKSKDECENFCQNPANQEACMQFAKEKGLIPEEDLERMEQGKRQFMEAMQSMPPETYSCFESSVGADMVAKFKNGQAMPPQEIGDVMRDCFEKSMQANMPPPGGAQGTPPGAPEQMMQDFGPGEGQGPPSGATGPGGCASPEECETYCRANPQACGVEAPQGLVPGTEQEQEMMLPQGMMPPGAENFGPPQTGPMTSPQAPDLSPSGAGTGEEQAQPQDTAPLAPLAEEIQPLSSDSETSGGAGEIGP